MPFAQGLIVETEAGSVEIVEVSRDIPPGLWDKLFAAHALESRYYQVVEETLRGQFGFRYAILKNQRLGKTAIAPFFLAEVNVLSGLPGYLRAIISCMTAVWPHLTRCKGLFVGCAAGEGALDSMEPWAVRSLDEALVAYARKEKAKLVVFKDFPAPYRQAFDPLLSMGYRRIASMPSTRLDLGFSSFEEYMELKMSSGVRSNLKRKLRDSKKLANITLEVVSDVSQSIDEIYPLYLQTHRRSTFGFERLTSAYFLGLSQRLPDRVRYFLWREEGKVVAFAVGLVHESVLYYLNVGMDYAEALKLHLYFCVWRDLVTWALEQNLEAIQAGQLNYEPKFRLGLTLVPLDLYVRPLSPILGGALGSILPFLGPTRYEPALRKFANFGELLSP